MDEQIVEVADRAARRALKAELPKIVTEQLGSDLRQAFVITGLIADPEGLGSTVDGDFRTFRR